MPDAPAVGLISLLEAHGIICIYRDLSALGIAALASTAASGRTLMFLDAASPRTDLAHAIAHELGHLCLGTGVSKAEEERAEFFAASLLMPVHAARTDDNLIPDLDVAAAAERWGVHPRTLIHRLRDTKIITPTEYRDLARAARTIPPSKGHPSLLGSPSVLATAVNGMRGSRAAADRALLSQDELRSRFLSRSGL